MVEKKYLHFFILSLIIIIMLACNSSTKSNDVNTPSFMLENDPIWSPYSNKIFYIHGGKRTTPGIYCVNPDGTNDSIVFSTIDVRHIRFGNSEEEFVFTAYDQIWKYNYITDNSVMLTNTPGGNFFPSVSPDKKNILYSKSMGTDGYERGVWSIQYDGCNDKFITLGMEPCYFPDGSGFVYTGWGNTEGSEIFRYAFKDSSALKLTDMKYPCKTPQVSPDGKLIVFVHYANRVDYSDIYIMNSNGSRLRRLVKNGLEPSFSPDSKWVVYVNTNSRDGRVWKIRVDGSHGMPLTPIAPDSVYEYHESLKH